jgi:hypothetical protein
MRRTTLPTICLLTVTAFALSACGKAEVKTGNLTQRFSMVDDKGVHFGVVEMDPISGGSITDVQGRLVGRIVPPLNATVAQAMPAELPVVQ